MAINIDPKTRLYLWRLLINGGTQWQPLARPEISASVRTELVEAGLLTEAWAVPHGADRKKITQQNYDRKKRSERKSPKPVDQSEKEEAKKPKKPPESKCIFVTLTAKGRDYLAAQCSSPVSAASKASGPVLNWLLEKMSQNASLLSGLKDLVASDAVAAPAELTSENLLKHINSLPLSEFMPGGGLQLSVLKKSLPAFSGAEVDKALLSLSREGKIVLYQYADPRRVTPEDEAAALHVSGVVKNFLFINA
ncbi:MAG: hypothetical protein LBJ64_03165 [Deltaproteobacteria bacterium]|jgi:hypothetical protein|nr:hypothetical protein [Deltaproteobacteria bacterium]